MIENPLDFGAGKIGVRHEARRFPDVPSKPARNKLVHDRRGAPALPDNRVVDGPPRRLVPDHGGFPLVGNADGGNVFDGNVELGDKLHHDGILGRINLQRIMLDPALAGIDLGEFLLDHSGKVEFAVKQYGAGTGRPLIQRHDIATHAASFGAALLWRYGSPGLRCRESASFIAAGRGVLCSVLKS